MLLFYILRLALVITPIAVIAVYSKQGGWKYGFTFIQNSLEVGLFLAFSISFLLACYHALSFEVVGKVPNENYLRSSQKVRVRGVKTLDDLKAFVEEHMRVLDVDLQGNTLNFRKKAIFMPPDKVSIKKVNDDLFEIESKPFNKLWLIDFARNFKTVTTLGKFIKGKK